MLRAHLLAAGAVAMFLCWGCGGSEDDTEGAPGSRATDEVRTALDPAPRAVGTGRSATETAKKSSAVPEARNIERGSVPSPPSAEPADGTATSGTGTADGATVSAKTAAALPTPGAAKDWSSLTLDVPFVIGYEKGLAEVRTRRKPGMFLVVTSWCKYSKELAEKNFRDPEIKSLLDRFVCVLVDAEAEPVAAGQLGAQGYPFVVFRDAAGNTLLSLGGAREPEAFKQSIRQALALRAGKSS